MSSETHHLVAIDLDLGAKKRKQKSRNSLAGVVTQARKAGLDVAKYEIDIDGKISVVIGKPVGTTEIESASDIKKLM
jgi:hypothetical protein